MQYKSMLLTDTHKNIKSSKHLNWISSLIKKNTFFNILEENQSKLM